MAPIPLWWHTPRHKNSTVPLLAANLTLSFCMCTGTRADVKVDSTESGKAKVTVRSGGGVGASPHGGWPKDGDDWKRALKAAAPWIAGIAVVLAAGTAYKRSKCENDKDEMSYGELTRRKAGRAGDKARKGWDDTKDEVERGWFGLKRKSEEAADEAGDKVNSAKDAAARKAREAGSVVKDKAGDAKEAAKDTGSWASHKAHEAADAAKGAYRSAADSTSRAAQKVEDRVGAAGSAVLAGASATEEKVGANMKEAGAALQRDGSQSKRFYKGQQTKEDTKAKCSIM